MRNGARVSVIVRDKVANVQFRLSNSERYLVVGLVWYVGLVGLGQPNKRLVSLFTVGRGT